MVLFRPFRAGNACDNTYQITYSNGVDNPGLRAFTRATNTAGNRQRWTLSFWLLNSSPGISKNIFSWGINTTTAETINTDTSGVLNITNFLGSIAITTDINVSDATGWHHIVIAFDSTQPVAVDRLKVYQNGIQKSVTSGVVTLNGNSNINNNVASAIGATSTTTTVANYTTFGFAEWIFVDGLQLTPSSFGFFTSRREWAPRQYTGSFGTRGFYLKLNDLTNVGLDSSGNSINYTVTGSLPSFTSPTSNAISWNLLNSQNILPRFGTGILSNSTNASGNTAVSAHVFSSGKYYFDMIVNNDINPANSMYIGIAPVRLQYARNFITGSTSDSYAYRSDGQRFSNNTASAYGASYAIGDRIGVAIDFNNNKIFFSKNGVWQNSSDPVAGTNPAFTITPGEYFIACSFVSATNGGWLYHSPSNSNPNFTFYTPPTGFLFPNLKDKLINEGAPLIQKPNQFFDVVTATGNGATQNITSLQFQPDLIIGKRIDSTGNWKWVDSTRGATLAISSNNTNAQVTDSDGITAFLPNGFSLGANADYNAAGGTYVYYCFKRNVSSGFNIIAYTGNGVNRTIAHGLGVTPKIIIIKNLSTNSTNMVMYHASLNTPQSQYLELNTQNAATTSTTIWNNTLPTSSVFSLGGSGADTNTNGDSYIAYIFADVKYFQRAYFYLGIGTARPVSVVNFKPAFLFSKNATTGSTDWRVFDYKTDTNNPRFSLSFNNNAALGNTNNILFLSNGFAGATADVNNNLYITHSIAEVPEINVCNVNATGYQ